MNSHRRLGIFLAAIGLLVVSLAQASAQSPSVLYTWDDRGNPVPNIESWIRGFGAADTSATLDNNTFGQLTITETSIAAGGSQAFSDGFNRVRESSVASSGGLDLTGLDYLQWDMGHNGLGNVNVQFYVQATPASTFVALGPDLPVAPGINTYQVPLTGLTPAQAVYVRTLGINIRNHADEGNLVWTIQEVRSGGTPLTHRDLVTFNTGTAEGGLQGAIANFDLGAIIGNDGGQNQTGLRHNPAGSGSLQWTDQGHHDVGDPSGGAVSWGNGTAWNGNSFNNRTTDLSNYKFMLVRMKATDPLDEGGLLNVQAFFQKNNFAFDSPGTLPLPIDGQYHNLVYSLAGLAVPETMNVVDMTGVNLGSHRNDLIIDIDLVRFYVPEPTSLSLVGIALLLFGGVRRGRRA